MGRVEFVASAVIGVLAATSAAAEPVRDFAVPAGTLGDALIVIGQQGGVTIGVGDPAVARLPVPAVRGRLTVRAALARLTRRLPVRAEPIDAMSWRIVPVPAPPRRQPPIRRAAVLQPMATAPDDIVVTATKRDTLLDHYAGTAYVIDGGALGGNRDPAGTDAIVARVPTVASTALGPGRNKLFIRGVADSSFNGPSQATAGQYLGDLRLNYNAPDPNLALIDIGAVEVLEGPQGTLYGAGTLGGVIRLVPEAVRLDRAEAIAAVGRGTTAHGADSGDASFVVNLPLASGTAGLRAVAYRSVEGGYIDDAGRGLSDVNRTRTLGGRLAARVLPGDGWSIDAGITFQEINTADGQYAERGLPPLTRTSRIAQPFDNDYLLGGLTVAKQFGRLSFQSATGVVVHDTNSTYDFTPPGGEARAFGQRNRIRLVSSENRLSRRDADGIGWVAGLGILHDSEDLTRTLGPVADPARILGVSNSVTNISGFGEIGFRLFPAIVLTTGARIDFAHLTGEALDRKEAGTGEPRRNELSVLPSLAVSWQATPETTVFARYQQGFRPGGLAVASDGGSLSVQRFLGDSIATVEGGLRTRDLLGGRVDAGATASYAHWEKIQADIIDDRGLPITANIGSGRILGLEAQAGWRPNPMVRLSAAVFVNRSRLSSPNAAFAAARDASLPNIAKLGARAAIDVAVPAGERLTLSGGASVRHTGASRLGVGTAFSFEQGRYNDTAANLRLGDARYGVTLDATNLFDSKGNRFGLGDPFDVAQGLQVVPLRPRTIRVGIDARF